MKRLACVRVPSAWDFTCGRGVRRAVAAAGLLLCVGLFAWMGLRSAGVESVAGVPATTPELLAASKTGAVARRSVDALPIRLQSAVSARLGAESARFRVTHIAGSRLLASGGGVSTVFARSGPIVRAGGAALTFRVSAVGYGTGPLSLASSGAVATGNRVLYRRGAVSEWYRNGPLGLEQGFTLSRPPRSSKGGVTISERLSGHLITRRAGAGLAFARTATGPVLLRYSAPTAVDATGRSLPARFQLHGATVLVRIDDARARYPVTIDPLIQPGTQLTGSGATAQSAFGMSVALSSDGNTALIGGPADTTYLGGVGAVWVFTRSGSTWTQQGPQLTGSGEIGNADFGDSVALSADGSTALIGGPRDNNSVGAAWVFTRSGGVWTQQGAKLTASDEAAPVQVYGGSYFGGGSWGQSVALSADGSTALIGGFHDNGTVVTQNGATEYFSVGAAWVFTRSGGVWSQQGLKLTASDETGPSAFGGSVALSADGNTALIGDGQPGVVSTGAWVFTRTAGVWSQQGLELPALAGGRSVALSADGSTALMCGNAAWVFTRTAGAWSQQGPELSGNGMLGCMNVALSADGSTALIAGGGNGFESAWVFTRSGLTWTQQGRGQSGFGIRAALSGDGSTALIAGAGTGSPAWVFGIETVPPAAFAVVSPGSGSQNLAPHPTFSWDQTTDSGSGVDHYELWIDGSEDQSVPISACSAGICSAQTITGLSDGSHTWLVDAVDAADNVRSSSSQSFTVDAVAPASFSNLAPADGSRSSATTPALQWEASSDSGSGLGGYRVMIDGSQNGPDLPSTATSYTPGAALPDGTHTWQVLAFDQVGNVRQGPVSHLIVDTEPPSPAVTVDSQDPLTGATVKFDASTSSDPEGASLVRYEWDPTGTGAFATSTGATPAFQYSYPTPGVYHAAVRVTNEVGSASTASVTIRVHPAPPAGPTGVSVDNAALYTNDQQVTLNVVWPAGADTMLVSNDGGFASAQTFPVASSVPWTLDSAGSERLPKTVYVRFGSSTQTFTDDIILDTIPPLIASATLAGSQAQTANLASRRPYAALAQSAASAAVDFSADASSVQSYQVDVSASDDNSGLGGMQITTQTSTPGPLLPFAADAAYLGSTPPQWVRVADRAGNLSAWAQIAAVGAHTSGTTTVGQAKVSTTAASVPVSCNGATGATCKVTLTLTITETVNGGKVTAVTAAKKATPKTKKKVVVLGTTTVTLTTGQSKTVRITLNGTGKQLLAKHHSLKVKLAITGSGKTVSGRTVTFTAKPQNKH